jgi:hypothetical protein
VDVFVVEDKAKDRWFERVVVVAPDEYEARKRAAEVAAREELSEATKAAMHGRWLTPACTSAKALGVGSGEPGVVLTDFDGCHRTTYVDDEAVRCAVGSASVYRLAMPELPNGDPVPHMVVRAPDEATARKVAGEFGGRWGRTVVEALTWLDADKVECVPVSLAEAHVVYGDRV